MERHPVGHELQTGRATKPEISVTMATGSYRARLEPPLHCCATAWIESRSARGGFQLTHCLSLNSQIPSFAL
jgi:hypothetical protein